MEGEKPDCREDVLDGGWGVRAGGINTAGWDTAITDIFPLGARGEVTGHESPEAVGVRVGLPMAGPGPKLVVFCDPMGDCGARRGGDG